MNSKGLILSVLLGIVSSLYVQIGAYLSIGEALCLAMVPFLLTLGAYKNLSKEHRITIVLFAGWLVGAVVSDVYNANSIEYALRGWGQLVLFCGSYLAFLGLMLRKQFRIDWFMVGVTISRAINIIGMRPGNIDARNEDDFAYAGWKLIYGQVLDCGTIAVAAIVFRKRPMLAGLIMAVAGLVNIAMGARSAGGVQLIAAFSALWVRYGTRINANGMPIISGKQRLAVAVALLVCAFGVYQAYFGFAQTGTFGLQAQEKAVAESDGRFGAISMSRVQLLGGCLAVKDAPIIGYGSWALDWNGYLRQAASIVGAVTNEDPRGVGRIPSHSYIVEYWVEHGILGALFWFWASYRIFGLVMTAGRAGWGEVGFCMLLFWGLAWNLFFSPLGDRMMIAAWLLYVMANSEERVTLLGLSWGARGRYMQPKRV